MLKWEWDVGSGGWGEHECGAGEKMDSFYIILVDCFSNMAFWLSRGFC